MRNYIILNGKSSNLIGGLIIQELPPITKPQIRTEVEQIDGRDGDIVTRLGYSAYDKTIKIGLHGDYDVDEVIRYFTSSGTVTFSNEIDKYYYYQINDKIDFAKLIRFKTADVSMHVQPFKYSSTDHPIIGGKNLLSIPDQTITKNGLTVTVDDGLITVSGTASNSTEMYLSMDDLNVYAGRYMLQSDVTGTNDIALRLIEDVPVNDQSLGNSYFNPVDEKKIFTQNSSIKLRYIWIYFPVATYNMSFSLSLSAFFARIINLGNTSSKPVYKITGSGDIGLYVDGVLAFSMSMTTDSITLDVDQMEAFDGDVLLNRHVSGDYRNLMLVSGLNVISWTGNVTSVVIDKYSRWI